MNSRKWRNFFYNLEQKEPKHDPNLSLIDETIFDSMDMTYLTESDIRLLMEGRKQNAINKYGEELEEETMETLIGFDEPYKFKHLLWMSKQVAEYNGALEEDEYYEEVISGVRDFIKFGNRYKKRDLNSYVNLEELFMAYKNEILQPRIEKAKKKRSDNPVSTEFLRTGQGTVVYEDERYFVVRPDTTEASCHFGAKTRWCIAQDHNSYFSQYTEGSGKIFYFIKDDTKKNEDFNYKIAVELSSQSDNLHYDSIWDRHDEQYPIDSSDVHELFHSLHSDFGISSQTATDIAEAIQEHAEVNVPSNPLEALHDRIIAGEWDGGFVTINSDYDVDYEPQLYINATVTIKYAIKNKQLIEMLNQDAIDIESAEENIKEALSDDGELKEAIQNDVDIGASKYWWPNSWDSGDDAVSVEFTSSSKESLTDTIVIRLVAFTDPDTGGRYHDQDSIIQFCEYMKEEWGERNELDIMEVLDHHLIRYIPDFMKANADHFRSLKTQFTSGMHTTENENLWYSVDDDDDEDSDLNLMMQFGFDMNQEYINNRIFAAKKITNTSNQEVLVSDISKIQALRLVNMDLSRETQIQRNLEKGIYNIYAAAREHAQKQLKLDFGPEWNDALNDEMVFPDTPPNININVGLEYEQRDTIVPNPVILSITFSIYIPFHRSKAELDLIYNFFKFIQSNYDDVSAYIYKYLKQDVSIPSGSVGAGESMLKESMIHSILENKLFLKELNKEIKIYNTKKKRSTPWLLR